MLCSGVLMAGMNAERLKREDQSLVQGMIKTKIDSNQGVIRAWSFSSGTTNILSRRLRLAINIDPD
jgi:hypothetical protein